MQDVTIIKKKTKQNKTKQKTCKKMLVEVSYMFELLEV